MYFYARKLGVIWVSYTVVREYFLVEFIQYSPYYYAPPRKYAFFHSVGNLSYCYRQWFCSNVSIITLTGNPKSVLAIAVCRCTIGSMLRLLTISVHLLIIWPFHNVNLTFYLGGIHSVYSCIKNCPKIILTFFKVIHMFEQFNAIFLYSIENGFTQL